MRHASQIFSFASSAGVREGPTGHLGPECPALGPQTRHPLLVGAGLEVLAWKTSMLESEEAVGFVLVSNQRQNLATASLE